MKKILLMILIFLLFAIVGLKFAPFLKVKNIIVTKKPIFGGKLEFLKGKNIFSLPKGQILQILKNDRITNISIKKKLPSTIIISFVEKKDIFFVRKAELFLPIDKDKVILSFDGYKDIPIIDYQINNLGIGDTIKNSFVDSVFSLYSKILEKNPSFAKKISEFFEQYDKIYFTKSNPINYVCLGASGIEKNILRLESLEKNINLENRMIDLSFKNQLIYREAKR